MKTIKYMNISFKYAQEVITVSISIDAETIHMENRESQQYQTLNTKGGKTNTR